MKLLMDLLAGISEYEQLLGALNREVEGLQKALIWEGD